MLTATGGMLGAVAALSAESAQSAGTLSQCRLVADVNSIFGLHLHVNSFNDALVMLVEPHLACSNLQLLLLTVDDSTIDDSKRLLQTDGRLRCVAVGLQCSKHDVHVRKPEIRSSFCMCF